MPFIWCTKDSVYKIVLLYIYIYTYIYTHMIYIVLPLCLGYRTMLFHSQSWCRHQMETFSALLALLWVDFIDHRRISHTKASDAEFWCFLWSVPEQTLEQQWRRRWFETPSRSLWRQRNGISHKVRIQLLLRCALVSSGTANLSTYMSWSIYWLWSSRASEEIE